MILAVAAMLLLVFSNVFWIIQNQQTGAHQQALAAQLSEQEQILALIGSGRAQQVQLSAVSDTNGQAALPAAKLTCDPHGTLALLTVENFPALPADKVYQLWMRQNGQPVSIGLFRVDPAGRGTAVVSAPQAIDNFESAGITLEPAGGSPKPTGQPIVRGTLEY
jgi:anti-sigma-K factor RskA